MKHRSADLEARNEDVVAAGSENRGVRCENSYHSPEPLLYPRKMSDI